MAEAAQKQRVPAVEVVDLKKHFPIKKGLMRRTVGHVHAVDGVSFAIYEGETLGLVGESGCGKSTVGRLLLRLIEPSAGSIMVDGADVSRMSKAEMRPYRRQMQIIFRIRSPRSIRACPPATSSASRSWCTAFRTANAPSASPAVRARRSAAGANETFR